MMSDAYRQSTRSLRLWIGITLRCLPPASFLLLALIFTIGAVGAVGLLRMIWATGAVIFLALAWDLTWRVLRGRASGRYLAALESGRMPVTIARRPHVAIAATMIAIALLALSVSISLAGTLAATIDGLCWLLAMLAGVFAFIYWRRTSFPMILSESCLTDHTAHLENIAWARISNCRIWAPKGFPQGIFIEIKPERGWDEKRKTIGINCLDLAARPEEVLTMFELRGAQKLHP